jgi:hypothetical protein
MAGPHLKKPKDRMQMHFLIPNPNLLEKMSCEKDVSAPAQNTASSECQLLALFINKHG